jgi:hypothetical protein
MDAKNMEALTFGPERMLPKLANLAKVPPRIIAQAVEEFRSSYGELYPAMFVKEYIICAKVFESAWTAKTPREKEYVNQHIAAFFERENTKEVKGLLPPIEIADPDDPRRRPALVADFDSGMVTIKPRTLLDWLAKSVLEYRHKLAVCERQGCSHPYFVRIHARQRFCSKECANSVRKTKKERWWTENKERFIKKWRQERKAAKRRKGI